MHLVGFHYKNIGQWFQYTQQIRNGGNNEDAVLVQVAVLGHWKVQLVGFVLTMAGHSAGLGATASCWPDNGNSAPCMYVRR